MRECTEMTDWLEGHCILAAEEPSGSLEVDRLEQQQGEARMCTDSDLLTYCGKLCFQGDFCYQVELG